MNRALRATLFLAALHAGTRSASAQSFNVDLGLSTHALPAATFGAGANQPGYWNGVDESSTPAFTRALLDLNGLPTGVTLALTTFGSMSLAPLVFPNEPGFSADQAALYADSVELSMPGPATFTLTISGLAPGAYDVYAYVGNDFSEGNFSILECPSGSAGCAFFNGTFTLGSAWAVRCCQAGSSTLTLDLGTCFSPLSVAAVGGLQLVRRAFSCADTSEPYCFGQALGSACACPCGNCGLADRGCDHSFATGGGRLSTTGLADVSADTLVLRAEFLPPTSSALFFQGTSAHAAGFGAVYGDGLRCVSGASIRLGTRFATAGLVTFGAGQGLDPLVSVAGFVPASGGTRYYQVWYRNAPNFCTPASVNLTNGFKVRWVP